MSDNALVTQDQNTDAALQVSGEQILKYVQQLHADATEALNHIYQIGKSDNEEFTNALTVVDNSIAALVELGSQNSAIVDGYQAIVVELTSQRDQAMQNFQELQETFEEETEQAYHAGLTHIWECPDCRAEFEEHLAESEREDKDWLLEQLRRYDNAALAEQIENKIAEAHRLRQEADKLIEQAESFVTLERHKSHAVVVSIGDDDELDDDDDSEDQLA